MVVATRPPSTPISRCLAPRYGLIALSNQPSPFRPRDVPPFPLKAIAEVVVARLAPPSPATIWQRAVSVFSRKKEQKGEKKGQLISISY